jgi:8-oxo-dGTP pyrophosphatase MutT (NUDIX family)
MGEQPATRPPVTPRPAASVILLRGGAEALEVLLLQRAETLRFMGGAWVFPGGSVDAADRPAGTEDAEAADDLAHRAAAVREAEEEAGVRLPDPAALVPFARWVTPADRPIRFDCRFFLAEVPGDQDATADGVEMVGARWIAPAAAIGAGERGELRLPTPTASQLGDIAGFATVAELLTWARARAGAIAAIEPPAGTRDPGESSPEHRLAH